MAESNIIVAGNALHVTLRNRREEGHDQPEDQRPRKDQTYPFKARNREDHPNHARHVERVVSGQEDILQTGKAGDENIGHHTKRHNQRGRGPIFFQRNGNNRFIIGDNALDIKGVFKHTA